MKRREFIAGLGGTVAWPLAAWALQGERLRRVGMFLALDEDDPVEKSWLTAFTQALVDSGWTDGRNVRMYVRGDLADVDRIQRSRKSWSVCNPT
jgi:putative tryptophan/tyrosine transport system substrate-binding protein